jgi:hypothetical protein
LVVLALAAPAAAQAQAFVYIAPAPVYRPVPVYMAPPFDPSRVQLARRYSLGLRLDVSGINQTVAGEDTVMGGGGLMFRSRHSRHWGWEFAVDGMGATLGGGRFERSTIPITGSLLCHLTPRGVFDLYLIGGLGYVASDVRIQNPPGHPGLAEGRQSFGEFQAHFGIGAELRLGRAFGIVSDIRYVGRVLTQAEDGQYYKDVDDGPVPSSSQGYQFTLGGLIHF